MAIVSGTFSGTGQSAVIAAKKIHIRMDFAGTASVDVEVQMPSGSWIKTATGIVADYDMAYHSAAMTSMRLNCTAHTNNVEYTMEAV